MNQIPKSFVQPSDFEVAQEPDTIAAGRVGRVLIVGVVVTIVAVGVAGWLLSALRAGLAWHEPATSRAAPLQIAGVYQTPIERGAHGWDLRKRKRLALEEYRWVSREHGIAEIPIERAMDLVIERAGKDQGRP